MFWFGVLRMGGIDDTAPLFWLDHYMLWFLSFWALIVVIASGQGKALRGLIFSWNVDLHPPFMGGFSDKAHEH